MDYLSAFAQAISACDITPPDKINGDGTLHRFSSSGKSGDDAGWYVLHLDGIPAGAFGCYRTGITEKWRSNVSNINDRRSQEDIKQAAALAAAARKQREADEQALIQQARKQSADMLACGTPLNQHPYLAEKKIEGIKTLPKQAGAVEHGDLLLIPVRNAQRELIGIQRIYASGDKRFIEGTRPSGCYHAIGKPSNPLVICEGFATAASLHLATGLGCIIAFNAGNLGPVAALFRERFPEHEILIAADDDRFATPSKAFPKGNPGITCAKAAAAQSRCDVRVPAFDTDDGRPTDWNDFAQRYGLERTRLSFLKLESTQQPEPAREIEYLPHEPKKPPTIDYLSHLPDLSDDKTPKPLTTIANLREILRRCGVVCRYNVIRKNEELIIPGHGFSSDNDSNASLAWVLSEMEKFGMSSGKAGEYLTFLADQNPYNPVANWISSKAWDGRSRLDELCDTLISPMAKPLKKLLIRKWMISAVAAAYAADGVAAQGVLVLQGAQYVGKTTWFKRLAPASLEAVQDGLFLQPSDRDSVKQVCSFWLVELGELDATFRKADISALKAFITRKQDVLRSAYARKDSRFARRTVFFGTVNPLEFLQDQTGNRRYWCIECHAINNDHDIDMQQVWAEILVMYRAGETHYLTDAELENLNAENERMTVREPIEDRLMTMYCWAAENKLWRWMTVTDAMIVAGMDNPSRADVTTAGHIIRRLNGGVCKKSNGSRLVLMPPVVAKIYHPRVGVEEARGDRD